MTPQNPTASEIPYVTLLALVNETNRCPGGKGTVRRIARRLGIGSSTQVLEVGSNTGFTSIEMCKLTRCSIVGVDVNQAAVDRADEWRRRLPDSLSSRVRFQVGDACNLPFDDGTFDVIICGGANTFIQDRSRAFEEYRRVLRPYGFVSITNLYYRTSPPSSLLADLRRILGFEIPPNGLQEWLSILRPDGWDLYDLQTTDLTSRSESVVDRYVDTLCEATLARLSPLAREQITEQWRHVIHVFNRNHAFLGFMELSLRREERDGPEQAELFLTPGTFDPFFDLDFVARECERPPQRE